jgi:hypothetical protein
MKPTFKDLIERQADQAKAREKRATQARRLVAKQDDVLPVESTDESAATVSTSQPRKITRPSRPWAKVRGGEARLPFYSRSEERTQLIVQPWAQQIVSTLLAAADEGGVRLCLAWPVRFDSLVVLHALASMERNFVGDLRGLRTLLYPGTFSSRAALQGALVDRERLSDFYRALWTVGIAATTFQAHTRSPSFMAMLEALNDIRTHDPEVENPSLAEVIPAFVYDAGGHRWASVVQSPLERSLRKVERLAHRRNIRLKVNSEWADPRNAPGALMVLHHTAGKEAWREALLAPALGGEGKPEVILLDATSSANQTNYRAVRRIPEFLRYAADNGYQNEGAVIITDDPTIFFVLRARLHELKLNPKSQIWAAEAEEAVLSANAVPVDWKPEQRSNANFSVSIVDRDASQAALAFHRLASDAGNESSASHQALMAACLYVMRLSNMPAGYKDLTSSAADAGGEDFVSRRHAWTPVQLGLQAVLHSGVLNTKRAEADKAITKAEQLIDAWTDATPMAARLLTEVQKHAVEGRGGLAIVLPNKSYISLAHRFLKRKLASQWAMAETRLDWHTLWSVSKTLTGERKGRQLIFVGVNRSVLRLLMTHPAVPHGTTVLISYKQAESTLMTLTSMKEIEEFKPYRGRMGLLGQEIERRLKEVPNPLAIRNLGELTMTFKLEDDNRYGAGEQAYYKFELEGGGGAYASSWVYRYEPDDDPFFRRTATSSIKEGDFIFEMSDGLRVKVESALGLTVDSMGSFVYPERAFLKLYHDDVKSRCELLFKATKRSILAREIHAKMIELDSKAHECRVGRVYYWLALQAEGDTRPHAPKDTKFFKIFCKALQISDEDAVKNWNFIRNARRLNQNLGRELAARYAEILFQPESATVYRKVPASVIKQLQQEALSCVYRVERVIPPQTREAA